MIEIFHNCNNEQEQAQLDSNYQSFCDLLFQEIGTYLDLKGCCKNIRKKFNHHKPYWNEKRTKLWKAMRVDDRMFQRSPGTRLCKKLLYKRFVDCQNKFDRELRKARRTYNRGFCIELDNIDTSDPTQFWKYIKSLGTKTKKDIPMKVYHTNALTCDIGVVLDTWREEFSSLYNNDRQETDFYAQSLRHKLLFQQRMEEPDYQENEYLNEPLSYDEVEKVFIKLQSNKAMGIDQIPNEILQKGLA